MPKAENKHFILSKKQIVKKRIELIIKILISIIAFVYIFHRLYNIPKEYFSTFINSLFSNSKSVLFLIIVFILLFFNILTESYKWKILIDRIEKISLFTSLKAVLGGMSVSVFTPNRIGEFFGRVFILEKAKPVHGILLTTVGNVSQLLITFVFGTIAYMFFAIKYLLNSNLFPDKIIIISMVILLIISTIFVILFFNISLLRYFKNIFSQKFATKIDNAIKAVYDLPKVLLFKTVGLSALKYCIFITQFILCIKLTGIDYPIPKLIVIIPLIYLGLAIIPNFAFTEIGIRGSLLIVLCEIAMGYGRNALPSSETIELFTAATLIWAINIALPSFLGIFSLRKFTFIKNKNDF